MKFTGFFLMLGVFVGCQSKVAPPQHKEPFSVIDIIVLAYTGGDGE